MPKFSIEITRIGYAAASIEVEAATLEEAQRLALDAAPDHEFSEHDAQYVLADDLPETEGDAPDPLCYFRCDACPGSVAGPSG